MAPLAQFRWKQDLVVIARNVEHAKQQILHALADLGTLVIAQMVDYAKVHAPWTDRTANARQGLSGVSTASGTRLHLALYHTMDYGIYLETRWGGRWGILLRTMREYLPRIMRLLRGLLAGV